MSMCLRKTLEAFIRHKRSTINEWIMELKRQALINLDTTTANMLIELENHIGTLMPLKTQYSPNEYITALRSHALILSYLNELLEMVKNMLPPDMIRDIMLKMISLVKGGLSLDFGGIAIQCKNLLQSLHEIGNQIFAEGTRKYLVTIIESCGFGELSKEGEFLLRESIASLIQSMEKPYITMEEISMKMGIKENQTKKIIKKLSSIYPEILSKNDIISTRQKIETWIENTIKEKVSEEEVHKLKDLFPEQLESAYITNAKKLTKMFNNLLEGE